MKQLQYILFIFAVGLSLSCTRDQTAESDEGGKLVKVTLSCRISPMSEPASKSAAPIVRSSNGGSNFSTTLISKTSIAEDNDSKAQSKSDGTTLLYNFWVFQFNKDGNRVHVDKLPNIPAPIKDLAEIETELKIGKNQTIYLVSMGKSLGESIDLSGITTISDLESLNINYLETSLEGSISKVQSDEDVPYSGYASGLTIVEGHNEGGRGYIKYDHTSEFKGGISMKSMMAKITYKVKYNVTGYSLKTIGLLNIPKTFRLSSADPNCQYSEMVQVDVSKLTANGDGEYELSWYVALNQQGVEPSITQESDRHSVAPSGAAPQSGALIKMWVANVTNKESMALYWIYLGNNNTSNFNIDPHTHYTFSTSPTTVPSSIDKRIEFISETLSIVSDMTIDNHYDKRGININVSKGTLTVIVANSSSATTPIDPNDSWMKLSTYSNYTSAHQNSDLVTSKTIDIRSNQRVKIWAYIDENLNTASSRSIYVTAILRAEDNTLIKSKSLNFTQPKMNYFGNFGGTFDETSGEYSLGLGYENITEFAYSYPNTVYGAGVTGIYVGYSGINLHGAGYRVEDIYSGKEATLASVYNTANYTITNGTPLVEPIKNADGSLSLYQYNYYTEYGARVCYNKNRDSNGNGKLDEDEINWYMPSQAQVMILLTSRDIASPAILSTSYGSTTEAVPYDTYSSNMVDDYRCFYGIFLGADPTTTTQVRTATITVRCVRDLPKF